MSVRAATDRDAHSELIKELRPLQRRRKQAPLRVPPLATGWRTSRIGRFVATSGLVHQGGRGRPELP